MEENILLATTKTGCDIYITSTTREHMLAHADVDLSFVAEAIATNDTYNGPFEIKSYDLGRIIGTTKCIELTDAIRSKRFWAKRKGRKINSSLIMDEQPIATSMIVVGICLDKDGFHKMFTSFYGELATKEIDDPRLTDEERPEAEEFWNNHALIVTPEEIETDE